jgi:uncharacterized membrane-anchored protein YhcB (DUF1043 family)
LIGDKSFLLGLGIGMIITAILFTASPSQNISKYKLEKMARDIGMMYPDEIKAFFNNSNQR